MKSGPTLAEATRTHLARKAAISPVATVVLPAPEATPETTRRGMSVGTGSSCHGRPRTGRWQPQAGAGTMEAVRIVSLLPSATEIVFALGLQDDLVGVTHECDWPPAARDKPVVSVSALPPAATPAEVDALVSASLGEGEPIYRLDEIAMRDLRPDLVLSQDLCAVCAVPSGRVNEALDVLGCQAEV